MGALGHDAGHSAVSRQTPWINEWGLWAMFFISNPVIWQHQHTYSHHSFTNEHARDPDVQHFRPLLRSHKQSKYRRMCAFQSNTLYLFATYTLSVWGSILYLPIDVLISGSMYGVVSWQSTNRPLQAIGMILHMAVYELVVIAIPLLTHSSLSTAALAIYVHLTTIGLIFSLFSQINHLNEPSMELLLTTINKQQRDRDPRALHSWAADQVETSNNFALQQSRLWYFLSNGLNFQIEHHLFPGLNHCHLYHIAPVVKSTCAEFGVNYKSYDTINDLVAATYEWICKLSVDDGGGEEVELKAKAA
jgi:fatty acid desaturase